MRFLAIPLLVAGAAVVGACDGGDDGPRPLERIDGPAQVDPEFRDGGGGGDSDDRSDPDG